LSIKKKIIKLFKRSKNVYTHTMKELIKKNVEKHSSSLEGFALHTTKHIGSPLSLVVHTCFFVGIFSLQWFGFGFDQIMLILTTAVSLEAIYLSIFIQMTINHQAHKLTAVSKDVEEISDDVEEISDDVEEISKDIDDIQEDVEEISEDVDELGKQDERKALKHQSEQEKIYHIENILRELLQEIRSFEDKKK